MSLNGAIQVGRSALIASQTAMQVTGNNLANAATEGFSRRVVHMAPARDELGFGNQYVGRGVQVASITRVVDEALLARYRDALSEQQASVAGQGFLSQIETLQNELSENDVSTLLSEFFNSWSELSNNPEDGATRAVVIQQGSSIASRLADLRSDYSVLRGQVDNQIATTVEQVNDIVERVAQINVEVAQLEVETGEAAALRDQRDLLINELAEYFEIDVYEQPGGATNVLVNSLPIVLGGEGIGIELRRESVDGDLEISLALRDRGFEFQPKSGTLGALLASRSGGVDQAIDQIETLATTLITEVNRVHSQGQPQSDVSTWTGAIAVGTTDANLNSGDVGLLNQVDNGSFMLHVTHKESGQRVAHRIDVDGNAMSLDDLVDQINVNVGVGNMTAGITADRRLELTAEEGYAISFSEDSSGALAGLGMNVFFTGTGATDMDVHQDLLDAPGRLSVGADHISGSNGTALAIVALESQDLQDLNDQSLREYWQNSVNQLAVRAGQARDSVETNGLVAESLKAQLQSISGVSIDEETINLLGYQRQYQAAARFVQTINDTLQELLNIV
ncbi:MAG: flagellar hook-associated protein FlgK [Phycisphaerales bacterium]